MRLFNKIPESSGRRRFLAQAAGLSGLAATGALGYLMTGCETESRKEQESKKLLTIDITNAFPVNRSELISGREKLIEQYLVELFQKYSSSPDLIRMLSMARIRLEVSSDERETKTWKGGNEGLSEAREETIKSLYKKVIGSASKNYPRLDFF